MSSTMDVFNQDKIVDDLLDFFKRRRYIDAGYDESENPELGALIGELAFKTPDKNNFCNSSLVTDMDLAERQFTVYYVWVTSNGENHMNYQLYPTLAPMLCHLYVDGLAMNPPSACVAFMKKLAPSLLKDEWLNFVEELISANSYEEVLSKNNLSFIRDYKTSVEVTPECFTNLRNLLIEKNLYILSSLLHSWFDFTLLTKDCLNDEKDTDSQEEDSIWAVQKKRNYVDGFEVNVVDKYMEDLLREIQLKRLQPTPPPPLLLFTAHRTQGVVCAQVSSECNLAVTGDKRSEIRIWGLGETKLTPSLHPYYFDSVPLAAYTEPYDDSQTQNERQVWSLRGHSETVYDLTIIDSNNLLSVSFDSTMRLWDMSRYACAAVYRGHSSPIWGVDYCVPNKFAATASQDRTARIWSLDRTFPIRILAGHLDDVTCVSFHPNGSYIATGSIDRTVRLWCLTSGTMLRMYGGPPFQGAVYTICFSTNGHYIASGGEDKYVWIWDLAFATPIYKLSCSGLKINCLEWSHDGASVAGAAEDGCVYLWSLDSDQACSGLIEPTKYLTKCAPLLSLQYTIKNSLVSVGIAKVT